MIQLTDKLTGHLTTAIHGTDEDLKEYSELISIRELKDNNILNTWRMVNGELTKAEFEINELESSITWIDNDFSIFPYIRFDYS